MLDYQKVYECLLEQPLEANDKGWASLHCPMPNHDDSKKSFVINLQKGNYFCNACGAKGNLIKLIKKLKDGDPFKFINEVLGTNFKDEVPDEVPFDLIAERVDNFNKIKDSIVAQQIFDKTGWSLDTIKKHKIGYVKDYLVLPLFDGDKVVACQLHAIKDVKIKVSPLSDGLFYYSKQALWNVNEVRKADTVVLCEGVKDAISLNQQYEEGNFPYPATAQNRGARATLESLCSEFEGKRVFIIYDNDKDGRESAYNIQRELQSHDIEAFVYELTMLPNKGDITDYILGDFSVEKLGTNLERLALNQLDIEDEIQEITFKQLFEREFQGRKVKVKCTVASNIAKTYTFPSKIRRKSCYADTGKRCAIKEYGGCSECLYIKMGDVVQLNAAHASEAKLDSAIKKHFCKLGKGANLVIDTEEGEKLSFSEIVIKPTLEESNNTTDFLSQEMKVYVQNCTDIKMRPYEAIGYLVTNPNTQEVTMFITELRPSFNSFENFVVAEKEAALRECVLRGLKDNLVNDLSSQMKIYGRNDLILGYLLTYCSSRWFDLDGNRTRGWINTLVIGDTGQGKTAIAKWLTDTLQRGIIVSGQSSSRTGLVYTIETSKAGNAVKSGAYSYMNGQILIMDEFDKLAPEDRNTISDAMESGVVTVRRAASADLNTQTRLIATANPVHPVTGESVSLIEFPSGAHAFESMISPYVIRRLDFGLIASNKDIDRNAYFMEDTDTEPVFTADLLQALIDRAWNVKPEDIVFEDLKYMNSLIKDKLLDLSYPENVPLCEASVLRQKVSRLALAFANLYLNTSEDFKKTIVGKDQYKLAVDYLSKVYSAPNFRLTAYALKAKEEVTLDDATYKTIRDDIIHRSKAEAVQGSMSYDTIIRELIAAVDPIPAAQLADFAGVNKNTMTDRLSYFSTHKLVKKVKGGNKPTVRLKLFTERFKDDVDIQGDVKNLYTFLRYVT